VIEESESQWLIGSAEAIFGRTDRELAGLWQRAVAFLARQALELAVQEALARRAAGTEQCSAHAQLLCLPEYVSTPVAREASYLWAVLSRACHQHPYELAPNWDELSDWLARVSLSCAALDQSSGSS
jgi:hypothetical protein